MITLETFQFTVGSSSGCDLLVDHPSVSRAHLKIYYTGDSVLIEDLKSEEGTFVFHQGEYKRIRSAKIKIDTVVRLGSTLKPIEVRELINNYNLTKEKNKKDISKRVREEGLKRCFDCGSVISKTKVHCDCCGAIFEE